MREIGTMSASPFGPASAAIAGRLCVAELTADVQATAEGRRVCSLSVPGMRCRARLAKLERTSQDSAGIVSARTKLGSRRVRLPPARADGDPGPAIAVVAGLGYAATPIGPAPEIRHGALPVDEVARLEELRRAGHRLNEPRRSRPRMPSGTSILVTLKALRLDPPAGREGISTSRAMAAKVPG